jgi:hypothetical protein
MTMFEYTVETTAGEMLPVFVGQNRPYEVGETITVGDTKRTIVRVERGLDDEAPKLIVR